MKNLIYLVVLFILSSCTSEKWITKHCDLFAEHCIVETDTTTIYRDSVFYLERIIPVVLPSDTAKIKATLKVVNNIANLSPVKSVHGIVVVTTEVINNEIITTAFLNDSSILVPVHDTITIEGAIKETLIENNIVLPPVKFIPKYYKFTFWFFNILVGILLCLIIWKISKLKKWFLIKVLKRSIPV